MNCRMCSRNFCTAARFFGTSQKSAQIIVTILLKVATRNLAGINTSSDGFKPKSVLRRCLANVFAIDDIAPASSYDPSHIPKTYIPAAGASILD